MKAALPAALAGGACGEAGRRAGEELAELVGLGPGASPGEIAEAASDPVRADALRAWGERLQRLLVGNPQVAAALVAGMERHAPGSGGGGGSWYGGDHPDFRSGVFLSDVIGVQVVLQQDRTAAAPAATASLPPRPAGFAGRDAATAELLAALDPTAPQSGSPAVLVAAVSGLGGVGKTALAVEAGHLAGERGWFPGGSLFVDLHGYDEEPVTAEQALQSLLRALRVPSDEIPAKPDEREVLYRSVLAERARTRGPVLVLADNASSPDQVRSLLPGDSRHRVLVTSRDKLTQLGARLVQLDQLTAEGSRELLDRALRIADPCDDRVIRTPEAAERLAVLCGHLPLALQIAAALLAEEPDMPVEELVDELETSHDRLLHLDDGERSVRAAFDLSYRRLPVEQARLLRLMALAPGTEVSHEVAAALVGSDTPPQRDLKALSRAHLVERGSGRGWWRLHDLVRVFGAGVVAGDEALREEGDAARGRVLGYYVRWADAADVRLRWLPGRVEPGRFGSREEALAWLDGERAGLVGAVSWGREERFAGTAMRLGLRLVEYLDWRLHLDDLVVVSRATREAAHRAGHREGESRAWNNLGNALRKAGRVREAIDVLTRARDTFRAAGDQHGEAMAWNNLGIALQDAGRAEEAIDAYTRARDAFEAAEDRHRAASAWNNLGVALRKAGRVREAIDALTRARDMHRAAGDRHSEAGVWNNLGIALREAGRVREAIDALTRARDMHRAAGDQHGEAGAWNNLGIALRVAGRVGEAITAYGRSLEMRRETEDWYGQGRVLHNLALAHEQSGHPTEARPLYLQAADAYTRANAPHKAARLRGYAAETGDGATTPAPTDKPTPAAPPARTADGVLPGPTPPGVPGSGGP